MIQGLTMRISQILLLTIILFLTGCNNSDLEKQNTNLQNQLDYVETVNTQLEMKLKELQGLKKELNTIKEKNKELSITLAKSELEFSKKHKGELKKEEERLATERINIEKNTQLLAEKNAKNKYMIIIASIVLFFLGFITFSWFKRNEYKKKISDNETAIEQLNKSTVELSQRVEERTKSIMSLELKIKEMEIRAKEGSINQVVRKIDENQGHRSNLLKRIEKDLKHA